MTNASKADPQGNSENTRNPAQHEELGDFSTTSRTLPISVLAMGIGRSARSLHWHCCD